MKEGILSNVLPDGRIKLAIVSKGRLRGSIELEPEKIGLVIQQLMAIAITSHRQTGGALIRGTEVPSTWPEIVASTIALGPSSYPDHEDLIVRFGDAKIGFPLNKTMLRSMGEAMLALSASAKTAS
jgi:hypothetical protein